MGIKSAHCGEQIGGDFDETLELGRIQFDAGDIDLVSLNIYGKAVTDAQLLLISAQADFFAALADYRAALAQEPLAE